jgi:C-terminal processing protease CtpA/Prc
MPVLERSRVTRSLATTLLVSAALFATAAQAQDSAPPPAEIVNDEGGPALITGSMGYTDPLFAEGISQPIVILEDQTGFVTRNRSYEFPLSSQVLGRFTTDFFSPPVRYVLNLPIVPSGPYNDVDQDGEDDPGVQIYAVAMWDNTWGDPYLDRRDMFGGGWSGNQATIILDPNPEARGEVIGGTYLVFTESDGQGFPSGFGDDGRLFTEDDPIVTLPAGWTTVSLDSDPFTFDRSREQELDLIEAEGAELTDYSALSFVDAFDAMLAELRDRYAYTELKSIDWDALEAEFRPRFEQATDDDDFDAYLFALRDFTWSIPDVHVGFSTDGTTVLDEDFAINTEGGFGMALLEVDDGSVQVSFVLPGSPADEAGIEVGAVVTEYNGQPIDEAISAVQPYSAPFSNPEAERYQQVRYLTRTPVGTEAEVTFENPDGETGTVTLTSVAERESFSFSSVRAGFEQPINPVNYRILDNGLGYIQVTTFFDKSLFTIQLWERGLGTMIDLGLPGIILDMRHNGGGSGWLANNMAGYFFSEDTEFGFTESFNEATGEFFREPDYVDRFFVPEEALQYTGEVVVLVGPDCVSACEFFTDVLQRLDRATVYGQYPTEGGGGAIDYFLLPGGIFYQYTATRELDLEGNVRLEGTGVVPDVDVPVLVGQTGDPVLDAAVSDLSAQLGLAPLEEVAVTVTEGGEVAAGEAVTVEVVQGERVAYTYTPESDETVDITLAGAGGEVVDTLVRVYDAEGAIIGENDDVELGVQVDSAIEGLELTGGETIIIEVGTYEDSGAGELELLISPAA